MVTSLLDNAVKFTEHGSVTLRARKLNGEEVRVEVVDAPEQPASPPAGDPVGVRASPRALRLPPLLALRPALTGLAQISSISLASTPMHSIPLLHPSQHQQARISSARRCARRSGTT